MLQLKSIAFGRTSLVSPVPLEVPTLAGSALMLLDGTCTGWMDCVLPGWNVGWIVDGTWIVGLDCVSLLSC